MKLNTKILIIAIISLILSYTSNKCLGYLTSASTPSSKEEFQISLASKFQLYKVYMDDIEVIKNGLSAVMTQPEESTQKSMLEELTKTIKSRREVNLKGLFNNKYVSNKAKKIYNLWMHESGRNVEEIFDELDNEIKADMKIAQSLGIDVSDYELQYKEHAFNHMMLLMLASKCK